MGRGESRPLRSLPRVFVPSVPEDLPETIVLPEEDVKKFRNVLRLSSGAEIAVLPGDGRLIRCTLDGHSARPFETLWPNTEPSTDLTLCLAMPKVEKIEECVRMGAEIGVGRFVLFPADRSVVHWDEKKRQHRLGRLRAIAREACEVSFRMRLPKILLAESLAEILETMPNAQVLSEQESAACRLRTADSVVIVIGPEGGWSPREVELIGDCGVTLGPRVLRVDTAAIAACAIVLSHER